MLSFEDFQETGSVQTTLFTPGFNFVTSKILTSLLGIGSELLDGDPEILPLPEDAPVDIPRITMKNKDNSLRLEAAPTRINFYRVKIKGDDRIAANEFIGLATDFLKETLNITGAKCGRMATVINRFCFRNNPGLEIAEHFCKEPFMKAPFDEPSAFELHAHKKYTFRSFDVNSWVRVKSGKVRPEQGISRPIVLVEQDINTLAELMESKSYNRREISTFFRHIIKEFDKILQLYFPG